MISCQMHEYEKFQTQWELTAIFELIELKLNNFFCGSSIETVNFNVSITARSLSTFSFVYLYNDACRFWTILKVVSKSNIMYLSAKIWNTFCIK